VPIIETFSKKPFGVFHGLELAMVFATEELLFTDEERELSRQVREYWTNFACVCFVAVVVVVTVVIVLIVFLSLDLSLCLSLCPSIYLSFFLSVFLSIIYLSISLSLSLSLQLLGGPQHPSRQRHQRPAGVARPRAGVQPDAGAQQGLPRHLQSQGPAVRRLGSGRSGAPAVTRFDRGWMGGEIGSPAELARRRSATSARVRTGTCARVGQ
jgi:hypothetical protein